MMEKIFRSRGLKFDDNGKFVSQKIYYEADSAFLPECEKLQNYTKQWDFFEFSLKNANIVDSVNFHTDSSTLNPKNLIMQDILGIEVVRRIFDESYKAYTIGVRMNGKEIVGYSIYYYPTIWKTNRYGLNGITDIEVIKEECNRFKEYLFVDDVRFAKYIALIRKLKGISVTSDQNGELSYKLYAYIDDIGLLNLFGDASDLEKAFKQYGNTKLTAIRIANEKVVGINLYYII